MRRAARVDDNHAAVADYLVSMGWSVISTAGLGKGVPDLVAGRPGFAAWIEVKDGSKPKSARKLTPAQAKFAERWTGPYILATSPQDALDQIVGMWKAWTK